MSVFIRFDEEQRNLQQFTIWAFGLHFLVKLLVNPRHHSIVFLFCFYRFQRHGLSN